MAPAVRAGDVAHVARVKPKSSIARARFPAESNWWTRNIWQRSFVATRSAMPYGIMALSLVGGLPLVVVLAAIGANVYWISLVLKLSDLLGGREAETATA